MLGNFEIHHEQGIHTAVVPDGHLCATALALTKLQEFGRVLYVGAHPDDENNKLIAYLAKERLMDVAYLSLTRGEGGQNFIGPETGDDLGILRVQESLQARHIDGGRQFFTRARDFGFSKCAHESIAVWGEDTLLEDLVYIIRFYRPDHIISRFSPVISDRHGHHQASAMLISKAFSLAAKADAYPEQLQRVELWQARQLLWNVYAESGVKEIGGQIKPKSHQMPLFIPAKSQYIEQSFSRLAADSRNQHRCQAMATLANDGASFEYFEWIAGEPLQKETFLQRTSANKEARSVLLDKYTAVALEKFLTGNKHQSIEALQAALWFIDRNTDDQRTLQKRTAIESVLLRLLGLDVKAYAAAATACPGEKIVVNISLSHDRLIPLRIIEVTGQAGGRYASEAIEGSQQFSITYTVPEEAAFTEAVWLEAGSERGRYLTKEIHKATSATSIPPLMLELKLAAGDTMLNLQVPILAGGSLESTYSKQQNLVIGPPVAGVFEQSSLLITDEKPAVIDVRLKGLRGGENRGVLRLTTTSSCRIRPARVSFRLKEGEEQTISFTLTCDGPSCSAEVGFEIDMGGEVYKQAMKRIDYTHITPQCYFSVSKLKVVKCIVKSSVKRIAYVKANEDEVATALGSFVEQVDCYDIAGFLTADISTYDAVVLGVRLYNYSRGYTWHVNRKLRDYVTRGGLVVSQYNTDYDLAGATVSPYPIQLSSNRITNAESPIQFMANHPILRYPNMITEADFEGWRHDRALFLPQVWDQDFLPVLSSADQGSWQESGLLLVAQKGKGYFVYTALSLFRQLPLAVPGAYRLFANMLNFRAADQN